MDYRCILVLMLYLLGKYTVSATYTNFSIELLDESDLSWCLAAKGSGQDHEPNIVYTYEKSPWRRILPCAKQGGEEYCVFSNPDFVGKGTSIITTPKRALEIQKFRAFSDADVQQVAARNMKQDVAYEVLEMTGKGMGLIATRKIEAGDKIMASTASIMVDRNLIRHGPKALTNLEVGAIDSLPEEHRWEYLNLSTHYHTKEHSERISRIILFNAFDISLGEVLGEVEDNLSEVKFKSVFTEVSRMNHDCRPNAGYNFDVNTFMHNVYAVRPIFAGEEITTSYIDPVRTREERSRQLEQSWHFKCSCPSCSQTKEMIAVSDARVRQIQYLQEQLRNNILAPSTATGMVELLISLYEQEGLWLLIDEAYTLAALQYNGIGEPWLATKYARLAIQSGIRSSGIMDKNVRDNMALAENPWEHWSWMATSRKH